MKLLLDTHVLLWSLMDTGKLSAKATYEMLSSENECYVSAVSFWEISMKQGMGKLDLGGVKAEELQERVEMMGMTPLPLTPKVAAGFGSVPRLHGDPFDRMLIHTSMEGDYQLVSADQAFAAYVEHGLKLIW